MAALGHEVVEVVSARSLLMEPLGDAIMLGQPFFKAWIRCDDQKTVGFKEGKSPFEGIQRGSSGRDRFLSPRKVPEIEDGSIQSRLQGGWKNQWKVEMIC